VLECRKLKLLTLLLEWSEHFVMEVAAEPVQTPKKKRSQSEKVGRLKYIIQLEDEQNKRLEKIERILRILAKGLGCFLKFEQQMAS